MIKCFLGILHVDIFKTARLSSSHKLTLILSITLPSVIAIIGGIIYYITFRQYRAQTLILHNIQKEMAKQSKLYSYHELKVATRDFHLGNKLGEGNFGVVYKVSSFFYTMYTHNHLCIILCMNSINHSKRLLIFISIYIYILHEILQFKCFKLCFTMLNMSYQIVPHN
jgi:hypothetical protein